MRTSSQKFVCKLKKSMVTSIVVRLTHCGQYLLERDVTRAMMNLHQYRSSLVNRGACSVQSFSDVLKEAAAVFAHALNTLSSSAPTTPGPTTSTITTSALSPNNQGNLRRKYLGDLRTFKPAFKWCAVRY